jgi:hypothetical protein
VQDVVSEAFDNLTNGPTWVIGEDMRAAVAMMGSITRNQAVQFIAEASSAAMGSDSRRVDG